MGRFGFGPFDSDSGHDTFCRIEEKLCRPILAMRTERGRHYYSDDAYAAVALALAIERTHPGLFTHDEKPKEEPTHRLSRGKSRKRARLKQRRYYSFWEISIEAMDWLLAEVAMAGDGPDVTAYCERVRVYIAEIKMVQQRLLSVKASLAASLAVSPSRRPPSRHKDKRKAAVAEIAEMKDRLARKKKAVKKEARS